MKICMYLDGMAMSAIYIVDLLKIEFEKRNVTFDIFVNPKKNGACFTDKILSQSCFNYIDVKFDLPSPSQYDCLIATDALGAGITNHPEVVNSFLSKNKKVLIVKTSTNLDHVFLRRPMYVNKNVKYGIPGEMIKYAKNFSRMFKPYLGKINIFDCPVLYNYSYEKVNSLKRENFYLKYNLDEDKELIGFFPCSGRGSQFPSENWQYKNLERLNNEVFKPNGYQLICKLHPWEYYGCKSNLFGLNGRRTNDIYFPSVPVIDEEDAHELIKFCKLTFTHSSAFTFEQYLYQIPALNIGFENVGNMWLNFDKKLSGFSDVVYGQIINFAKFKESPEDIFLNFLNKKHDFKFWNYHPIYGNSFNSSVSDICELYLKQIKEW